jgi:hypothetical protein
MFCPQQRGPLAKGHGLGEPDGAKPDDGDGKVGDGDAKVLAVVRVMGRLCQRCEVAVPARVEEWCLWRR